VHVFVAAVVRRLPHDWAVVDVVHQLGGAPKLFDFRVSAWQFPACLAQGCDPKLLLVSDQIGAMTVKPEVEQAELQRLEFQL
jgi:hypothetical protein